jgi:hypothetical protein
VNRSIGAAASPGTPGGDPSTDDDSDERREKTGEGDERDVDQAELEQRTPR